MAPHSSIAGVHFSGLGTCERTANVLTSETVVHFSTRRETCTPPLLPSHVLPATVVPVSTRLSRVAVPWMVFLLALCAGAQQFVQPCYTIEPNGFCPTCPGLEACRCLYVGADCPSSQSVCDPAQKVELGGDQPVHQSTQSCYLYAPCTSKYGGACHPINNPCVRGSYVSLGTQPKYTYVVGDCSP